jgi:hypothetical protein
LTIRGDIRFENPVIITGRVILTNPDNDQKVVTSGTVINTDQTL